MPIPAAGRSSSVSSAPLLGVYGETALLQLNFLEQWLTVSCGPTAEFSLQKNLFQE